MTNARRTTSKDSFSPLVHAVGGSAGSALALLLLYPLERARIELQASVVDSTQQQQQEQHENDKEHVNAPKEETKTPLQPPSQPPQPSATTATPSSVSFPTKPPEDNEGDDDDDESWMDAAQSEAFSLSSATTTTSDSFASFVFSHQQQQPPLFQQQMSNPQEDNDKKEQQAVTRTAKGDDANDVHQSLKERFDKVATTHDTFQNKEAMDRTKPSVWRCLQRVSARGELYKGATPICLTLAVSNFVFFWIRTGLQRQRIASRLLTWLLAQKKNKKMKNATELAEALDSLVASTMGGILNVLLTNPLWVANLRIVTGRAQCSTLWGELSYVYQTHDKPWRHLWQGTVSSLWLVSNPVLQFVLYEQFKRAILWMRQQQQHRQGKRNATQPLGASLQFLSPVEAFAAGAVSKAISTMVTYPLQLTQAVMRLQQQQQQQGEEGDTPGATAPVHQRRCNNTWDCLRQIYHQDRFQGLYTGLRAKLWQTVLTAAFTFLTYEQILRAVQQAVLVTSTRKHPKD